MNPAFRRWWLARRTDRALPDIKDEKSRKEAWDRNYKELCTVSRLINAELAKLEGPRFVDFDFTKPLDGEPWPWPLNGEPGRAYITNPESCSIFRTLVFLRYGITFRELICEKERDPRAHRKLMRVHKDYRQFRWGKPMEKSKMKFNLDHFGIILQGLDLGLKELNEDELADCLDAICPCGDRHASNYLTKLRTRIIKACRSLPLRNAQPTSSR